ncbi:hypothetical protein [Amycolatopsis sp. cmx-4-68]|uniref:hypothetical protein n=1 Tax=Amycolatopsis sp. cmx-4-68 TaxID=2790938 RepID=UPI00397C7578
MRNQPITVSDSPRERAAAEETTVDENEPDRHQRRRTNYAARAAFAEARQAGLVQRHILKLARLSERARHTGRHRAGGLPDTSPFPRVPGIGTPSGPRTVPPPRDQPEDPTQAA